MLKKRRRKRNREKEEEKKKKHSHKNYKENIGTKLITNTKKQKVSFNFIAAITICSDLGAPKNKV